jgi:hypothetical protein
MLSKPTLMIWLRRKENRYVRYFLAGLSLLAAAFIVMMVFTAISPRYFLTLAGRFSVLTPTGFKVDTMYDFQTENALQADALNGGALILPLPDSREITFRYPEAASLGDPLSLGEEITKSVSFTLSRQEAHGLIQIWVLKESLGDFLRKSKEQSQTQYLAFEETSHKQDSLQYTLWDYTFESRGKTIHGLEAFFDDPPYMYRISLFIDAKDYDAHTKDIFDEMVKSVKVE